MKKYSFILLILVISSNAAAYTRITTSSGQLPKWSSMPIPYWINDRGSAQISNGSEFTAVHASFQTWQNVPSAGVRFNYLGATSIRTAGRDGFNVISFADDATPLGSSTVAVTFQFFRSDLGQVVYDDADIVFNPALNFSTSGETGKFDIQAVAIHEIGHFLGLDHAGLISSAMVPFASLSQLDQRTLEYDDIAGVTDLYPAASAATAVGVIQGTILAGTTPVFGAHVVAVDSGGTALVSTLSQPTGSYTINFLPPGVYRVYAEPLDHPVTEAFVGGGSNSFYRNLKTDFGTTYFGGVSTQTEAATIEVTANGTATANIQTLPRNSTGLNLTRPAFGLRVARGTHETLRIGGDDVTAGIAVTASNPGLILDTPSFGGRLASVAPVSVSMDLFVSDSVPLGPKNIAANRGAAASIVSGGVVVTEPRPQTDSVAPASGPIQGGSLVTISGSNFRPGAKVFLGGVPLVNVQVVNAGTMLVETPVNSPGPMS
ncbi:MAG: matrixin family metalloprotease, partial [Acidobacteria bacterium]|nr:matrixin family metalloprotease [Acidobacteriota bacterium]